MTGISGINSMWWALRGIPVTIVDEERDRIDLIKRVWKDVSLEANIVYQPRGEFPVPIGDKAFDMSWNFASLWFVLDLGRFLGELTRITNKVIFLCVPNRLGVGHISRLVFQEESDHPLHSENIIPLRIKDIMHKLRWRVFEQGFLDTPPWPDIAMKKEDLLQRIGLKRVADRFRDKNERMCILDYYSGKKKNMENEILKYAFLENSPWIVRRFWAHHEFFIFTRS